MNAGAKVNSDLAAPTMNPAGLFNAPITPLENMNPKATVNATVAMLRSEISLLEKCHTEVLLGTVEIEIAGSTPKIRLNGVPVLFACTTRTPLSPRLQLPSSRDGRWLFWRRNWSMRSSSSHQALGSRSPFMELPVGKGLFQIIVIRFPREMACSTRIRPSPSTQFPALIPTTNHSQCFEEG